MSWLSVWLSIWTNSVPKHTVGELLWSPAVSSKMLCIPFLKDHHVREFFIVNLFDENL